MQLPLPTSDQALPGRDIPIQVSEIHFVNGNLIKPPFENEIEFADFALGCFWGAERKFWEIENVYSTACWLYGWIYT
jgi:Peptide methionine sulfoxide reductase